MRFLYQFGINSYWFLIRVFSLFKPKAKRFISGRKNWKQVLSEKRSDNDKYVWVHCASLGEFEQGRPFIEAVKKEHPHYKICLSFFSPSGYEIRKNYELADIVCYLPKDSRTNAREFIRILNPEIAVFVKYEFWYHYLKTLNKSDIPTYLISAIFRDNQIFFRWYGSFFRKMLSQYRHIFVQDEKSLDKLKSLNLTAVSVSGDTRFDRVWEITHQTFNDEKIESFVGENNCLIAGSTWPQDESVLLELMRRNADFRMVLAPHETDDQHVNQIMEKFQEFQPQRYTSDTPLVDGGRLLVIDTIGLLSGLYRFGNIAYIGGGFGKGIHNTLEAACYGLPVLFGPNYLRFKEAVDLVERGGGFSVNTADELTSVYSDLMTDDEFSAKGKISESYVEEKRGATQKILKHLDENDVF